MPLVSVTFSATLSRSINSNYYQVAVCVRIERVYVKELSCRHAQRDCNFLVYRFRFTSSDCVLSRFEESYNCSGK